jgi:hypothetical protein
MTAEQHLQRPTTVYGGQLLTARGNVENHPPAARSCPSIRPAATSACSSGQRTADRTGPPGLAPGVGKGGAVANWIKEKRKKRLGRAGLGCQTARNGRARMSRVERRVSYAASSRWEAGSQRQRMTRQCAGVVVMDGIVAFEAVTDLGLCAQSARSYEGAFVVSFFQLPRCAGGAGRHLYDLIADKLASSGTAGESLGRLHRSRRRWHATKKEEK